MLLAIFDGIGTELIGIFVSFILGSVGGVFIGMKIKSKQIQTAGDNSEQVQKTSQIRDISNKKSKKIKKTNYQKQTAGKNSKQVQIND